MDLMANTRAMSIINNKAVTVTAELQSNNIACFHVSRKLYLRLYFYFFSALNIYK